MILSLRWIQLTGLLIRRLQKKTCLFRLFTWPGWQNGSPMLLCEWKKIAMTGDQAYLLFAFNTGKKYVWSSGLWTRFLPWKTAVVTKAAWGSLTSECNSPLLLKEYRCTDCKHSACTRFFFLLLFLGEKDTAHCINVVHRCQPVRMIRRA